MDEDSLEPRSLQLVLLAYPPADAAEDKKLFTACEQDQPEDLSLCENFGEEQKKLLVWFVVIFPIEIRLKRSRNVWDLFPRCCLHTLTGQVKCMGFFQQDMLNFQILWIPHDNSTLNLNGFHLNTDSEDLP